MCPIDITWIQVVAFETEIDIWIISTSQVLNWKSAETKRFRLFTVLQTNADDYCYELRNIMIISHGTHYVRWPCPCGILVASPMSLWLLWWPPTGSSMFMVVVMLLIYSVLHCLYSVGNKITTTTGMGNEINHLCVLSIRNNKFILLFVYHQNNFALKGVNVSIKVAF